MNPLQKRQAIQQALSPFMQGPQLANALILWDEKYAHQHHFALQHYLRDLCHDMAVAHLRSRMLQALVTAFSSLQDERQARQQLAQRVKKNNGLPQLANHSNQELMMFVALVEKLVDSSSDEMSTRIRLYVLENLIRVKVNAQERWSLQQWLNRITPLRQDLRLDTKVMQHIINLSYVAICEYQGPIKADQTLRTSVSQLKSEFPESPINFLL